MECNSFSKREWNNWKSRNIAGTMVIDWKYFGLLFRSRMDFYSI